jgi:hypothetical protein
MAVGTALGGWGGGWQAVGGWGLAIGGWRLGGWGWALLFEVVLLRLGAIPQKSSPPAPKLNCKTAFLPSPNSGIKEPPHPPHL